MPRFEWDPRKAVSNFKKHRVRFEDAVTAFDDPHALIASDDDHSADEPREVLLGMARNGVVMVIYTERSEHIRIISARKANKQERRRYEDHRSVSF